MSSDNESSEYSSDYISESSDENIQQEENLDLYCKIINNYNIIYEIGRGSYSIVWLAYNINNQKFYALKVQNPTEYKEGLNEIQFVKKLPTNPPVFNNLYEYFIENIDEKKYICSVWHLHSGNLDSLIRKGDFKNGLPIHLVESIMKQLIDALNILHNNFKVFHGDIKTDNILVKGLNQRDEFIINEYTKENFNEKYSNEKKNYWIGKGNNINNIDKMNKKIKSNIRLNIHEEITKKIIENMEELSISKYTIDVKYIENLQVSLADFGTYCSEYNYYDEPFGTRYYQAPEIILMGDCSYPVDIWALGCSLYELLTGQILFDPHKDADGTRDYYHLCLINETCGNFSPNFLKKTKYYKKYFNSKFDIIDYNNQLNNKLNNNEKIFTIITKMLMIDPTNRITIKQLKQKIS
jgi:serine/threonine-protein kinase SRPK3